MQGGAETPSAEQDRRVAEKLTRQLGDLVNAGLSDPEVTEIILNSNGALWFERFGRPMEQVGTMQPHEAEAIISTIASIYRTTVTFQSPKLERELPFNGSRFVGLIPPVVAAPCFTLRKKATRVFTLAEYVAGGIATPRQADTIRAAVAARRNILVVGGTGSGKTTLANAIIHAISEATPEHRVVMIEESVELQCSSPNHESLRAVEHFTTLDALRVTMRLRPDRIVVGEVRGVECLTLIDAWNTGHEGGVATVHANDARAGLTRVEALVRRAVTGAVPVQEIAAAVNLVVFITKTAEGRRIKEIVSVSGHDGSGFIFNNEDA